MTTILSHSPYHLFQLILIMSPWLFKHCQKIKIINKFTNISSSIHEVWICDAPLMSTCMHNFFIFVDIAGQVENISNTTNCSHTVSWGHPQPKELSISYYSYQLTSNNLLVESNVTTDHCVAFNLTVTKPNMLGFNFIVEAHTPPWNGTKVSIQLIAATGM